MGAIQSSILGMLGTAQQAVGIGKFVKQQGEAVKQSTIVAEEAKKHTAELETQRNIQAYEAQSKSMDLTDEADNLLAEFDAAMDDNPEIGTPAYEYTEEDAKLIESLDRMVARANNKAQQAKLYKDLYEMLKGGK